MLINGYAFTVKFYSVLIKPYHKSCIFRMKMETFSKQEVSLNNNYVVCWVLPLHFVSSLVKESVIWKIFMKVCIQVNIKFLQVQGFRLTQRWLNSCLLFYSITATCFSRMTWSNTRNRMQTTKFKIKFLAFYNILKPLMTLICDFVAEAQFIIGSEIIFTAVQFLYCVFVKLVLYDLYSFP
jgi:hypothetical protein